MKRGDGALGVVILVILGGAILYALWPLLTGSLYGGINP